MKPTFKEFLVNEAITPERRRALGAALKQIEKQYGKGMFDPERRAKESERRERQRKSREKYAAANKARDEEHQRRMETDPEYRRKREQELEDTKAFWDDYGRRRAAGDPSIVSKDGWTGD